MTLGQTLAGQWQVPLFILSLIAFGFVLFSLRPEKEHIDYQDRLAELRTFAEEDRYGQFYLEAEAVRQLAETEEELGRLYELVAATRVQELTQRHELGVSASVRSSSRKNYEQIIDDYANAFQRQTPAPDSPEAAGAYRSLGLAYWGLNESGKAIEAHRRAIELADTFDAAVHRELVDMFLAARPKEYLTDCMELLEAILAESSPSPDDHAWAFVRKAEVLIAQGHEEKALAMLAEFEGQDLPPKYRNEVDFLRGLGLRHTGHSDQADLILRNLMTRLDDRGDIYARTALTLGKINYEQYRYHDAHQFYQLVVQSQAGKDWYVAGKFGLAECSALHEDYSQAAIQYQEVVRFLNAKPHNRALEGITVRQSLATLAHRLAMLKQYDTALSFLTIEQDLAPKDDVDAAYRFARMHDARALQLLEQLDEQPAEDQPSPTAEQYQLQQREKITDHFHVAAEQFLRVADIATGDDELYGTALRRAAQAYDKAGDAEQAILAWQRYVAEREGHPFWPFALFHLAQTYQSIGEYQTAINHYENLIRKHPRLPAAFDSMIPLARCYLALDPPDRDRAKVILRGVLTDRALTPESSHFRDALFELGKLHYDSQEYPQAITILTQAIDRYPDDTMLGTALFIVGESYRKSGLALDKTLSDLAQEPGGAGNQQKMTDRRKEHLSNARSYFERAIAFYEKLPEKDFTELDRLYRRHCWVYLADSMYDLGQYAEATRAYEQTALHYQLTPTALISLVQIANCQLKLGNPVQARSANERGLWQLKKMSDDALAAGSVSMSRQEWTDWFTWTNTAGLW